MANGYNDWSRWGIGSPTEGAYSGFGDVPERAEVLGSLDPYQTPGDDWQQFISQAPPFWSTRAPMEDIGGRARARHLLAAPGMLEQNVTPSLGQFLEDFPTRFGEDPSFPGYSAAAPAIPGGPPRTPAEEIAELRARAWEAARAATTPYGEYMAGAVPETADWRRRAWLQRHFTGEGSAANQRSVANLLSLQRAGTRNPYAGNMATAIRSAMANLYQQRLNVGAPRENFLKWYLSQTETTPAQRWYAGREPGIWDSPETDPGAGPVGGGGFIPDYYQPTTPQAGPTNRTARGFQRDWTGTGENNVPILPTYDPDVMEALGLGGLG